MAAALVFVVLFASVGSAAPKKRAARRKVPPTTMVASVPLPTPAPDQTSPPAPESAIAQQLLVRANAERALRGLPALRWDPALAALATNWSQTMKSTGSFTHRPKGATAGFALPAACCWENIYMIGGTPLTANRLHEGWMRSTGHRNNILSPEVTAMGAGVVCGADGTSYATENFAADTWKGLGTPETVYEPRSPAPGDITC